MSALRIGTMSPKRVIPQHKTSGPPSVSVSVSVSGGAAGAGRTWRMTKGNIAAADEETVEKMYPPSKMREHTGTEQKTHTSMTESASLHC